MNIADMLVIRAKVRLHPDFLSTNFHELFFVLIRVIRGQLIIIRELFDHSFLFQTLLTKINQ